MGLGRLYPNPPGRDSCSTVGDKATSLSRALHQAMSNWAEEGDEDAVVEELPERYESEVGPDGVKTVIEYMVNPRTGQRMKVTKKIKVTKKMETHKKAVLARRTWPKFGVCIEDFQKDQAHKSKLPKDYLERYHGVGFGQEGITYHPEPHKLDFASKKKMAMKKKEVQEEVKAVGVWKRRETPGGVPSTGPGPAGTGGSSLAQLAAGKPSGAYVPPTLRGSDGQRRTDIDNIRPVRDDSSTLRVSNLSDDTTEDDLQQLFRPFGSLTRTYIAKDRNTGLSRGFAFVNFVRREDAAMAMEKLAGYGYDHLILQIEWAQPSNP